MLLDVIARQSLKVQSILLTHAHVDHVTGVSRAKHALQVPVHLHRDDQFLYDAAPQQAAFFGLHCDALPAIDRYYDLRRHSRSANTKSRSITRPDIVRAVSVSRLAARGRRKTISSSAIRCSPARLAEPISLVAIIPTLIRSITQVLFAFGDTARVHSGHGPQTTIGQERRTNPFLRPG